MRVTGLGDSTRRKARLAALVLIAATSGIGCSMLDGTPLSAGDVELEDGGGAGVAEVVVDPDDATGNTDDAAGSVGQADDGTGQAANGDGSSEETTSGGDDTAGAETTDGANGDDTSAGGGGAVAPSGNLGTVVLASSDSLISTNPSNPLMGYGRLTIDRVVAVTTYEETEPAPGNVFVVADYQVLGIENGNFLDTTFRANVDGTRYSAINNINLIPGPGGVANNVVWFEVPISALDQTVSIEGGVIDPTADGYAARYDVSFTGEPIPAPVELAADQLEATGAITQTSEGEALFTTNPAAPDLGVSSITARNAATVLKIGPDAAAPGFKFVQIDIETIGVSTTGNLLDQAFRLKADDEWYSPLGGINELSRPAEPFNTTLVFQVPRSALWMELEAGVPEEWAEGERTTFSIDFD